MANGTCLLAGCGYYCCLGDHAGHQAGGTKPDHARAEGTARV